MPGRLAVKVHDCLVFAADSASSLAATNTNGEQFIVNIYENANKVFNLGSQLPICAMTAGIGNFGTASISTLAKDMRRRMSTEGDPLWITPDDYSMKEVAENARKFLYEETFLRDCPDQAGSFDFWIGGYGASETLSEIWRVHISDGQCDQPVCEADKDIATIKWGGHV